MPFDQELLARKEATPRRGSEYARVSTVSNKGSLTRRDCHGRSGAQQGRRAAGQALLGLASSDGEPPYSGGWRRDKTDYRGRRTRDGAGIDWQSTPRLRIALRAGKAHEQDETSTTHDVLHEVRQQPRKRVEEVLDQEFHRPRPGKLRGGSAWTRSFCGRLPPTICPARQVADGAAMNVRRKWRAGETPATPSELLHL